MNKPNLDGRYTTAQLRFWIEDLETTANRTEIQEQILANLKAAKPSDSTAPVAFDAPSFSGREGGAPASNQYGTFEVHYASEAQVRFLKKLLAEVDTDAAGIAVPADVDKISKKSASPLIDKLLAAKNAGKVRVTDAPATAAGDGPSEKQVNFFVKLTNERFEGDLAEGMIAKFKQLPRRNASAAIDAMLKNPKLPQPTAPELKPGAYRLTDGRIVRVYLGQQSRKMLAAELVDITAEDRDDAWHYLGMASRFVKQSDHRLTVDEAEQLTANGMDHSWCCVCGKRLDDPNSVSRGIGPVCRSKQQSF